MKTLFSIFFVCISIFAQLDISQKVVFAKVGPYKIDETMFGDTKNLSVGEAEWINKKFLERTKKQDYSAIKRDGLYYKFKFIGHADACLEIADFYSFLPLQSLLPAQVFQYPIYFSWIIHSNEIDQQKS